MSEIKNEARRKVLRHIQNCAEMESYFRAKVLRTPIEESKDDAKIEAEYSKKLEKAVEIAIGLGITEEEIDEAICIGRDDADEAVAEAENDGYWN